MEGNLAVRSHFWKTTTRLCHWLHGHFGMARLTLALLDAGVKWSA